jgi:hypothetical protein
VTLGSLVQSHASDECFEDGAQGWNIDQLAGPGGPVVQYGCTRAAGTGREPLLVCLGTLLGPEGTGITPFTSDRPAGASSLFAMWRRRDASGTAPSSYARNSGDATSQDLDSRPYLENCTVDASIKYFVAKLVRAHGGCLGTRSR